MQPLRRCTFAPPGAAVLDRRSQKGQLGLDQFECRRYVAVQRHLILTAISHLVLARLRLKLVAEGQAAGGKNPDRAAGASRRGQLNPSRLAAAACTS